MNDTLPTPDPDAQGSRPVVLELKCCCCGTVQDTLRTPWDLADVQPQTIWTRQPCAPCELELSDPPGTAWERHDDPRAYSGERTDGLS